MHGLPYKIWVRNTNFKAKGNLLVFTVDFKNINLLFYTAFLQVICTLRPS